MSDESGVSPTHAAAGPEASDAAAAAPARPSVIAASPVAASSSTAPAADDSIDPSGAAPAASPTSASASSIAAAPAASASSTSSSLRGVPAGLKVLVHLRAAGAAPILKRNKFTLSAAHRFTVVVGWLRKVLHLKDSDPLFVFVNQAFAPNPDAIMFDLFQCYAVGGELILNYAVQDAWG